MESNFKTLMINIMTSLKERVISLSAEFRRKDHPYYPFQSSRVIPGRGDAHGREPYNLD
jgi:hypothetical protein